MYLSSAGDTVIKDVTEFLEDGQWHSFTEIRGRFHLSDTKLQEILSLLKKFEFASVDEDRKRAKLDSAFLELPV